MKINIQNTEKLSEAIKVAEGRATARTVKAEDIQYILHEIGEGIPKAKLNGTKVYYDGARQFPSAYRYMPESTHWSAENVKGRWYITEIKRSYCPNRINNTHIAYSEEAKQRILENASNCSF